MSNKLVNQNRNFVPKGWGYEDWIANISGSEISQQSFPGGAAPGDGYCGKILFVKKGKQCSWHYHKKKNEMFFILEGELLVKYVTLSDLGELLAKNSVEEAELLKMNSMVSQVTLKPGDSFHVEPGTRHRFIGLLDTKIIEFSTHHTDDDSYRVIKGD